MYKCLIANSKPINMKNLNPYLTFGGNCEEAFNFYRSVFGGEFSYLGRFSEMPPQEGMEISEEEANRIMHISLPISKEDVLMGSDTGDWAPALKSGNNISLSITVDTKEDVNTIFDKLAEGGEVTMPVEDMFWGDYMGMCVDKFGINWMIGAGGEMRK